MIPAPADAARDALLPGLRALCELLRHEGESARRAWTFFDQIRASLEAARAEEDLAGPFLQLSTSAFQGFAYSPAAAGLLDQVLATATELAQTLSAEPGGAH